MKVFILVSLLGSLFLSSPVRAETVSTVSAVVRELQPALSDRDAQEIAQEVTSQAEENHFDWKLFLAVLFQESSLHRDPHNCLKVRLHCRDFGIGQVNWRTWGIRWRLNKLLLVTNYPYAIGVSARIFAQYQNRFKAHDRYWLGRYNSGTLEYRRDYQKKVLRHYARIKAYLLNRYAYGRLRRTEPYRLENDYTYSGCQAAVYARSDSGPLCPLFRSDREIFREIQPESRPSSEVCSGREMG